MEFNRGFAFILEGSTEKVFYIAFLDWLCQKHNATIERIISDEGLDVVYLLKSANENVMVKFHTVNAITQLPRAGNWFKVQCVQKYGAKHKWQVFLCYDTDAYTKDVTKFYENDWKELRKNLSKASSVLDVAASADIEDVLLSDIVGVCEYLNCEQPEDLPGRKGKSKLKKLFREHGKFYHEGERATEFISKLNMEVIMEKNVIPLKEIEKEIFESS